MHKELADARILPLDCDMDKCLLKIEEDYENSRSLSVLLVGLLNPQDTSGGSDLIKRWGNIV